MLQVDKLSIGQLPHSATGCRETKCHRGIDARCHAIDRADRGLDARRQAIDRADRGFSPVGSRLVGLDPVFRPGGQVVAGRQVVDRAIAVFGDRLS